MDGSEFHKRTLLASGSEGQKTPSPRRGDLSSPGQRLVGRWRWQCDGSVSEYWFGPTRPGTKAGPLQVNDVGVVRRGAYRIIREDASAGKVTVESELLGGRRTFPIPADGSRLYESLSRDCTIEYAFVEAGLSAPVVSARRPHGHMAFERRGHASRGL